MEWIGGVIEQRTVSACSNNSSILLDGDDPLYYLQNYQQALVLLIEASIQQTAGDDGKALSTLLEADAAVDLIGERALREVLRASILSEIG